MQEQRGSVQQGNKYCSLKSAKCFLGYRLQVKSSQMRRQARIGNSDVTYQVKTIRNWQVNFENVENPQAFGSKRKLLHNCSKDVGKDIESRLVD